MHDEKTIQWFKRHGLTPPSHEAHGQIDDISNVVKPLELTNWRLEGNRLIAQHKGGEYAQYIPTDYIMTGIGKDGMPVLKKLA